MFNPESVADCCITLYKVKKCIFEVTSKSSLLLVQVIVIQNSSFFPLNGIRNVCKAQWMSQFIEIVEYRLNLYFILQYPWNFLPELGFKCCFIVLLVKCWCRTVCSQDSLSRSVIYSYGLSKKKSYFLLYRLSDIIGSSLLNFVF